MSNHYDPDDEKYNALGVFDPSDNTDPRVVAAKARVRNAVEPSPQEVKALISAIDANTLQNAIDVLAKGFAEARGWDKPTPTVCLVLAQIDIGGTRLHAEAPNKQAALTALILQVADFISKAR